MSDLAVHLGLRSNEELKKWIADAGLSVVEKLDIAPKHANQAINLTRYMRRAALR